MSVPRFNPMQNDEAIARSLQYQEQERRAHAAHRKNAMRDWQLR